MTHFLNWVDVILIGWVIVSAFVTPLVGRWLGNRFPDPSESEIAMHEPISFNARHDTVDVSVGAITCTGPNAGRAFFPLTISQVGSNRHTLITKRS